MALQGTLKDFSLADIFQLIGVQKKTGVLTLKHQDEVVTVSFLNGSVVAADSLPRKLEDRLGRVLVKSGAITEAQLQSALERQKRTLQRMGHILVSEGFIGQEELQEALTVQVTQLVYRLFRWHDGQYHFNQEDHLDYDRQNFRPVQAETILMEGARILDEWPLIEKRLKSFSQVFAKTDSERQVAVVDEEGDATDTADLGEDRGAPGPEGAGGSVGRKEALVYALVDGRRTVQDLVDRCRLSEFDTCKALFDLLGKKLIEEAGGDAGRRGPETRLPGIAPGRPARVPPGFPAVLIAVAAFLLATAHYNPLRLSPSLWRTTKEVFSQIRLAGARARLERIDYALQIHYLVHGRFPLELDELVEANVLAPADLLDPWGTPYQFHRFPGGYRVQGIDSAGNPMPGLEMEYRYPSAGIEFREIARDP